jgi:hypothetical protein
VRNDVEDVKAIVTEAFERMRLNVSIAARDPARLREALDYLETLKRAVEEGFDVVRRIANPPAS